MKVHFEVDQFGRLTCQLDPDSPAMATASNGAEAAAGLLSALESVEANGLGECFWKEAAGEYRWVFRREGDQLRVAVMWSTGVVTGWEHVYWAERPMAASIEALRHGLASVSE